MKLTLAQPNSRKDLLIIENPTVDRINFLIQSTGWEEYTSIKLETDNSNSMEVFGTRDFGLKILVMDNSRKLVSSNVIRSEKELSFPLLSYHLQDDEWRTHICWETDEKTCCRLPEKFSLGKFIITGIYYFFKQTLFAALGIRHRDGSLVNVSDDDPEMNTAIKTAVDSLSRFHFAFESNAPRYSDFTLKYKITQCGQTEHFWLKDIQKQGNDLIGYIDNIPEVVACVALGQKIIINPTRISDWGFMDNGVAQGYFTLKAILKNLSKSEQHHLMKTLGWENSSIP